MSFSHVLRFMLGFSLVLSFWSVVSYVQKTRLGTSFFFLSCWSWRACYFSGINSRRFRLGVARSGSCVHICSHIHALVCLYRRSSLAKCSTRTDIAILDSPDANGIYPGKSREIPGKTPGIPGKTGKNKKLIPELFHFHFLDCLQTKCFFNEFFSRHMCFMGYK